MFSALNKFNKIIKKFEITNEKQIHEHFKKWRQELTKDESDSILRYTGMHSNSINGYLRSFNGDKIADENVKNIDSALSKVAAPIDMVVFRLQKNREKVSYNDRLKESSYISTSLSPNYINEHYSQGDILIIKIKEGSLCAYLEDISLRKGEKEVLIPRESELKVLSKHKTLLGGSVIICELENSKSISKVTPKKESINKILERIDLKDINKKTGNNKVMSKNKDMVR